MGLSPVVNHNFSISSFRPPLIATTLSLLAIYLILTPKTTGDCSLASVKKETCSKAINVSRVAIPKILPSQTQLRKKDLSDEILKMQQHLEKGEYTIVEQMLRSMTRASSVAMMTEHRCEVTELFLRLIKLHQHNRATAMRIASLAPDQELQLFLRAYIQSAELRSFVKQMEQIVSLVQESKVDQARELHETVTALPIAKSKAAAFYIDCWARPLEGIAALVD